MTKLNPRRRRTNGEGTYDGILIKKYGDKSFGVYRYCGVKHKEGRSGSELLFMRDTLEKAVEDGTKEDTERGISYERVDTKMWDAVGVENIIIIHYDDGSEEVKNRVEYIVMGDTVRSCGIGEHNYAMGIKACKEIPRKEERHKKHREKESDKAIILNYLKDRLDFAQERALYCFNEEYNCGFKKEDTEDIIVLQHLIKELANRVYIRRAPGRHFMDMGDSRIDNEDEIKKMCDEYIKKYGKQLI